jgi:hypothetical protein
LGGWGAGLREFPLWGQADFGFEEDLENVALILFGEGVVVLSGFLGGEDFKESLEDELAHLFGHPLESFGVDEEAAGVLEQAFLEVEIFEGAAF